MHLLGSARLSSSSSHRIRLSRSEGSGKLFVVIVNKKSQGNQATMMHAWPVARSIFDAPSSKQADNKLNKGALCIDARSCSIVTSRDMSKRKRTLLFTNCATCSSSTLILSEKMRETRCCQNFDSKFPGTRIRQGQGPLKISQRCRAITHCSL